MMGADDRARWPVEAIEKWDVARLIPYARNSRRHTPEQVDRIAAAIREWGWTTPILVREDGTIIAGHARTMAAQKLGIPQVPVMVARGWTEAQCRAYVIADNALAESGASWDTELLRIEVDELKIDGFDLGLLGFEAEDFAALFPDVGPVENGKDPDETPPPPSEPHSREGDVWVLGPHRVACGDSTDPAVWAALMGTETGDLVMTDPPFGVSYQAKGKKAIANDDLTGERLREFLCRVNVQLFARLKSGSSVYMFHADSEGLAFRQAAVDAGFKVSQCLTWVKDSLVLGRSRYQWRHEPVLLLDKPGGKQRWWGGRKQTTVVEFGGEPFEQLEDGRWAIRNGDELLVIDGAATLEVLPGTIVRHPKPRRSAQHPTMKPVAMLERLMKNSARPNDIVIEPFGGSGSTLMAAERLGMCCRVVELDPSYVDVEVMRWQAYTGRAAEHALTGAAFPVAPVDCQGCC